MLKANVSYSGAIRYLQRIEKQSRFAAVQATTKTAWQVKDEETEALSRHLNNPTPFTKRSFRVQRATKQKPTAVVYAAEIQDKYLSAQVFGGQTRGHVPGKRQKLNAYGNLPRKATKRKNTFSATIKGVSGVWQRKGRGKNKRVELVAHFPKSRKYSKRLPFHETARRVVKQRYGQNFSMAFKRAMRTAR